MRTIEEEAAYWLAKAEGRDPDAEEFQRAVAVRTEEIIAERKHLNAMVSFKMGAGPKPRTERTDADELALVEAMKHARAVQARTDQLVQQYHIDHGTAGYVTVDGKPVRLGETIPTPMERAAYFAAKNAPVLDTREGPVFVS
jgi:hypothetical protein